MFDFSHLGLNLSGHKEKEIFLSEFAELKDSSNIYPNTFEEDDQEDLALFQQNE